MTPKEMHEFGLGLLIAYLHIQKGNLISANMSMSNHYPHLVVKNPKKVLLYVWIKTEMFPTIPSVRSIKNHEEVINISKQFNATPVFAGIRLKYTSTDKYISPINGGSYFAEFTRFKAI